MYPERIPLMLGPNMDALSPPMRVQALLPIPERRLAAASGKIDGGLALELIDVENATIKWRNTETCSGPLVYASTDRVICAGWKGIVALDVDSGREVWRSSLIYRTAGAGYVIARDKAQLGEGGILDVATGKKITRVQMPEGVDVNEVRHLCADKGGFDLYGWSPTGHLRRFRLGRRDENAYLVWSRRLRQEPSALSPCDPTIVLETPITGKRSRLLRTLSRKKGAWLGGRIEQFGWWPTTSTSRAPTGAADLEIATANGLERRDRRLGNSRPRADVHARGRLIASWAGLRMLRSVDGTSLIVDDSGVRHWLAAPTMVRQAVLTPSHILAGPWLGYPHSNMETLTLYRLPAPSADRPSTGPTIAAPLSATSPTVTSLERMPKTDTSAGKIIEFPHAGMFSVAQVALSGHLLYVATGPGNPRPGRGLGLAAFDLRSLKWGFYRPQACAPDADVVGIAVTEKAVICATAAPFPGPGVLRALSRDTGEPLWTTTLTTIDRAFGAGDTIVALVGSRAVIVDAARGRISYELVADNGHLPRIALSDGKVIAIETGGRVVARDLRGTPVWSVAVRGYIRELQAMPDAVAVHTHAGEFFLIRSHNGRTRAMDGKSMRWTSSGGGDLAIDSAHGRQGELILWAYDADGNERFRAAYPTIIEWDPSPLRGPDRNAPVLLMSRQPEPRLLRIDPNTGQIAARYAAPKRVYRKGVFSTIVDGRPLTGAVLENSLAIQVYRP